MLTMMEKHRVERNASGKQMELAARHREAESAAVEEHDTIHERENMRPRIHTHRLF
jgi:hypothetical protein